MQSVQIGTQSMDQKAQVTVNPTVLYKSGADQSRQTLTYEVKMAFVNINSGNKFFDREEVGYLESFQEIMTEPTNLEDIKEGLTPPTPEELHSKLAQLDKEAGDLPGLLTLTLDKEDLISLLDGIGTFWYMRPFLLIGMEKQSALAEFTGDQHNPSWSWKRDALEALPVESLWELYRETRRARDEDRDMPRTRMEAIDG
jgi:hypothetical protein